MSHEEEGRRWRSDASDGRGGGRAEPRAAAARGDEHRAATAANNPLRAHGRALLQRLRVQQRRQFRERWREEQRQWQLPPECYRQTEFDGRPQQSAYTPQQFYHDGPPIDSHGNHSNDGPCQLAVDLVAMNKRRRVRSILLLSAAAFLGCVALDGILHFRPEAVRRSVEGAADTIDGYERKLEDEWGRLQQHRRDGEGAHGSQSPQPQRLGEGEKEGTAGRFLRRLVASLLDDDGAEMEALPPHRSFEATNGGEANANAFVEGPNLIMEGDRPTARRAPALHALPLLPKRALQHRRRRELIARQLPIPNHLIEGADDEEYAVERAHRRRRMYPALRDFDAEEEGEAGDEHRLVRDLRGNAADDAPSYETGALYQGYGTHYLDLYVGSPPQRQTVIVDTGSSVTAFPCTGCQSCGANPTTGERYHTDADFVTAASESYEETQCHRGKREKGTTVVGYVPCGIGTCQRAIVGQRGNGKEEREERCHLAVSYAEGSSWTATEGSDVVYPSGPHDAALASRDDQVAAGVGAGMGSFSTASSGGDFDWMDFRLQFGCQSKVTGLFRTQLEDGIMGMDNRKGAFWMQLHEHYQRNGYAPPAEDDEDDAGAAFDPAQFSLCYDRQSLSMDLTPGVGSGALTLGGTDPLLHNTEMVYAENVTPQEGWYSVRIRAVFLRTGGGTLAEPPANANMDYIRVNADEPALNGNKAASSGVIVDSGTTDTYLPQGLKAPFNEAWNKAVGGNQGYNNNAQELTPEQVKSLPTILLVLQGHATNDKETAIGLTRSHEGMLRSNGGPTNQASLSDSDVVVAVPPSHYMEESTRTPGTFTARVYFSERFGGQSILGSNFLMGHEVNFDVGRGRIGFAESHCNYERYVQERDARAQSLAVEGTVQQMVEQVAPDEGEGSSNAERDPAANGPASNAAPMA